MNRRDFLTFLGACAASAALPPAFAGAKVARAINAGWAEKVLRFQTVCPLDPGRYTFSAWWKIDGQWRLFVAGIAAAGGETVIEVPYEQPGPLKDARLGNGITVESTPDGTWVHAQLERGEPGEWWLESGV